jgi:tRNA threonylcarbamoyladenosine biosynthesis protein TsaB
MLLLAVDTSGKNGSLALVRVQPAHQNPTQAKERLEWATQNFEVLELVPLAGRMYSAQLIPELQNALDRQKLKKSDIDAYAVASGPGSFTGLRVGLSTVKALSEVLHKPIAAVSVLEATARIAGVHGHVLAALDAGRQQLFVGDYEFDDNFKVINVQESLVSFEPIFAKGALIWGSPLRIFSPDRNVRDAAAAYNVTVGDIPAPQADMFARIGYEKIVRGETTPAETLEANYIRASDAELFSLPKLHP